jgi:glycosyltransferase involved in cell wall biosynthesis
MADRAVGYLSLQGTHEGQAAHAHVHEIVAGLKRRGWNVALFAPTYAAHGTNPAIRSRLSRFLTTQCLLARRMRSFGVIYVRLHFASLPTVWFARLFRVPVVVEVNGTHKDLFLAWPSAKRVGWLLRWAMRYQIRHAVAVIAVTPGLRDWATAEGATGPVHVIPNGANSELFCPGVPPFEDTPAPYVAFVGALAPWQGIDVMLRATHHPAWPDSTCLVVAGNGDLAPSIAQETERNTHVVYLGGVAYRAVPRLLANALAGVSVQTSPQGRADTGLYPLKVFEAMSCGIPVIVSDFPGQADLVREGGCGIVIPPESPADLAKAVAFLHDHPEKRLEMGKKGRALVESAHSWDARAAATAEVLERVLAKRGRRRRRT